MRRAVKLKMAELVLHLKYTCSCIKSVVLKNRLSVKVNVSHGLIAVGAVGVRFLLYLGHS